MYNRADNTARHALVSLVIRRYVTDVEWISKSTAISARVGREEDATGRIACSACAYERWKWYEIDVVSEMEHLRLSLDVIFAPLLAAAVLATKRISGPSPFSWHLLHSPDLSVIDCRLLWQKVHTRLTRNRRHFLSFSSFFSFPPTHCPHYWSVLLSAVVLQGTGRVEVIRSRLDHASGVTGRHHVLSVCDGDEVSRRRPPPWSRGVNSSSSFHSTASASFHLFKGKSDRHAGPVRLPWSSSTNVRYISVAISVGCDTLERYGSLSLLQ